jgi:hypothetical protein
VWPGAFPALACLAVFTTAAQADFGRLCQPRELTAAEKRAGEQVAERLRKSLPAAPAGWAVRDERSDVAAGTCQVQGKAVPQPLSVTVSRSFVRKDAQSEGGVAPQAAAPQPAAAPPNPQRRARAAELEKQLAELQAKDREAGNAYRAARSAGDSAAQREASEASRRYRTEMAPLMKELRELRSEERQERNAAGEARTRAAQARMAEARANRRDALVSIHTNAGQAQMRGAQPFAHASVPLAFRDARGATQLLFGEWRQNGSFALSSLDEMAPATRVQDASVRIDASGDVAEQLLRGTDLEGVRSLVQAPTRRQPPQAAAPVEVALQVGARKLQASGSGECKAAPQASIHGVPAALYSVSQNAGGHSLSLTLWQPKNGSEDMMSLAISADGKRYEVDTVKAGAMRATKGTGKAALEKTGAGGVFRVDAVAASGEKISGTVRCGSFGGIRAEGG